MQGAVESDELWYRIDRKEPGATWLNPDKLFPNSTPFQPGYTRLLNKVEPMCSHDNPRRCECKDHMLSHMDRCMA